MITDFLKSVNWSETGAVISPVSFSKLDEQSQAILNENKAAWRFTHSLSYEGVLEDFKHKKSMRLVIGLGGGTALDFAKYIAHSLDIDWVAIPSMLSTNVFATDKVAVIDSTGKHTEPGKLPVRVIFDDNYLEKSSRENLYGLVDVFSIYTALTDWQIALKADNLKIDEPIYNRAKNLLLTALKSAQSAEVELYGIKYVVTEAGYITNDYGSGRPESGSEHIFASALELVHPMPHALAVTLGMYIMDYYQRLQFPDITKAKSLTINQIPFLKLGIIDAINQLKLNWNTVLGVLTSLKPRKDKFTAVNFWNTLKLDFDQLKEYLEQNKFRFW